MAGLCWPGWLGYGIFGQRYDSSGGVLASEFRVNSYTSGFERWPSVASDASGNFIAVWDFHGLDGDGAGISGQRYDGNGVAQGAEFRVNSFTTGSQGLAFVTSDPNGNFSLRYSAVSPETFDWKEITVSTGLPSPSNATTSLPLSRLSAWRSSSFVGTQRSSPRSFEARVPMLILDVS